MENYEKAYQFLSINDKNSLSFKEYSHTENSKFNKFIKKNTKFRIIESIISESGESAQIKVSIDQPDLLLLFTKFPQLSKDNISEYEINKILSGIKIKEYRRNYETTYKLILESGNWRVSIDYGIKKRIKELESACENDFNNDNYEKSLNIAKKILEFDSSNKFAIDMILKNDERLDFIRNNIILNSENFNKNIKISVKNIGTIVVKRLSLELSLFDSKNQLIKSSIVSIIDKKLSKNRLEYDEEYFYNIKPDIEYSNYKINLKGIDF